MNIIYLINQKTIQLLFIVEVENGNPEVKYLCFLRLFAALSKLNRQNTTNIQFSIVNSQFSASGFARPLLHQKPELRLDSLLFQVLRMSLDPFDKHGG